MNPTLTMQSAEYLQPNSIFYFVKCFPDNESYVVHMIASTPCSFSAVISSSICGNTWNRIPKIEIHNQEIGK